MANDLHTHRSEQLLKVCRTLNARLEPQIVLREVIHAAMGLADSEAASILLHDEQTHQLLLAAIEPSDEERRPHPAMPLEGSIAGKAFVQREPQIMNDLSTAPTPRHRAGPSSCLAERNFIAVPLLLQDIPFGVLEVCDKRDGDFQPEDAEILNLLASHAAIALHNARLLESARQAYRELQHIDRMKSDFIAIASHELRTPLGIILGYATHLQETTEGPCKKPVSAIVRAAIKLKDLVEELSHLENSRQGQTVLRPEPTAIQDLLQEVIGHFQHQADMLGITLTLQMPSQTITASVDQEKVAILVRHLVRNALAFTDRGGQVDVRLEQQGEHFQIIVEDTGIGIPPDDLPHVFERFYQVEKHLTRRHGGLGLGLSIAKSMATAHGGTLHIESEEGRGTTVTAILPLTPKEAPDLPPLASTA